MRSDLSLAILASVIALSVGCGDFAESTADAPQVTMDAGGGTLALHAFRLDVPHGALDHAVTLQAHTTGEAGVVGEAFRVEPTELAFAADVTVTIAFDPATYAHPSELFVVTREGGHWTRLVPADQKAGHVAGPARHAGTFGLLHCPAGVCP